MKLIHTSDLHLGRRMNELSLVRDQKYIIDEMLTRVGELLPDAFIIAGDVYDKSIPSAEAVTLFDRLLTGLNSLGVRVFIIGGNHDSQQRLAFGSALLSENGIYISEEYSGSLSPVTLTDEYGEVLIYLLPFVKPAEVKRYFPDAEIESYTDAVRVALSEIPRGGAARRVLVTHQFVTGASRSESEEVSVGGSDNVDASVFSGFDYVALGHIHSPQNVGAENIRYSGTPLKYSFSECRDVKSLTLVTLGEAGALTVEAIPLVPMHEVVDLRGGYRELMARDFYKDTTYPTDLVRITLTDEEDIVDAVGRLRSVYTNLLELRYDNTRTRTAAASLEIGEVEKKSPMELFSELYEKQNGRGMTEEQTALVSELIEKIWEGEECDR